MKNRILRYLGAALLLAGSTTQAQTLVASNTTTSVNTLNHTATINYTPGADSGSFDFTLTYNSALMSTTTADITPSIPNGSTNCNVVVAGTINCISNANSSATDLGAGTITILFDIGATTGMSALTFTSANFFSQLGATEPGTTTNGSVTINAGPQPTFHTTTTSPITINTFVGDSTTNKATVNVDNTGQAGSTLQVTASMAPGTFGSVSPTAQQNIAQGAAAVPFTVTCTTAATGNNVETLSFATNESSGSPHNFTVNCNVAAAPAPVYSSAPVPTTPIVISAAVGGSATSTIVVTNTGNAPLNIGAPSGLSAPLSIAPNTAQNGIAGPNGTVTYTITCAPTSIGTFGPQTLTLGPTNEAGGPSYTYPVTCNGTNPAYSSVPPAPGPLTITTTPGVAGTATLTVSNTGSAGSVLNVTPSGLSGVLSVAPTGTTPITAPGSQAYTITCNSPDAGTFTGTLVMTHNATGSPVSYNVTCTVNGPEFSSSPAPGGGVTISAVPGTTGSANIAVTNSGNATLTVTCTPTGTGVSITSANPLNVNAASTANIVVACQVPAAPGTSSSGSLSCTTNDANEAGPFTYTVTCQSLITSIPTLSIVGKVLLGSMVLGLGLLGFGLRRKSAV